MSTIENQLRKKGLFFKQSIEEYTDHFSCLHEAYLERYETEQAALYVQVAINRLDAKQINKDYFLLHYKSKLIMTTTFSSVLLFCLFFVFSIDPPSIHPVQKDSSRITAHYGMMKHPIHKNKKMHKGIDFAANIGDPVVATADGTVITATYGKKNGYYIEIQHDNTYSTKYLHLSVLHVEKGDKVSLGQVIGEVGSTGISTGPHLHYEVLENGSAIDPTPFLKS